VSDVGREYTYVIPSKIESRRVGLNGLYSQLCYWGGGILEVKLYNYGPRAVFDVSGRSLEVGPDVFIAEEGVGTFEGVSLERRLEKLLMKGKDAYKMAASTHRESTRRGHASMTTSLQLMMEVRECSRALSMLLVAPPFGSYLRVVEKGEGRPRPHGFAPLVWVGKI
jgi:hypothetical protein